MKRTFNLTAKIAAAFALTMTLGASISPILANDSIAEETVEVSEDGCYRRLCTTEVFELPGSCSLQTSDSVAQSAAAAANTILTSLF